jgi:nucleoside-diphosphate-sugar epimerase
MSETPVPLEHVLVTGGTGRLGRFVVAELRSHYRVSALDRPETRPAPDVPADILDLPALERALRGQHAVVHLAAIDASVPAAPAVIFDTNVRGTWNVLEAAQRNGVRRVVLCSSVSALGVDYTNPGLPPLYLPIDEDHPLRPTQPYGLSKQLGEDIGRSFARRGPMAITCVRPAWIMFPETLAWLARHLRSTPDPAPPPEPLPLLRSYVAPEDVARAVRLALGRRGAAFATYFITASDTFEPRPTLEHLRDTYGVLPEIRKPERYHHNPRASAYDTARAHEELGWTPSGSWRELVARVEARPV